MAVFTLEQYINEVLLQIQCCIGELGATIADQEYLGIECESKKNDLQLLYAIQLSLVKYDPEADEEDSCLTTEEVNVLIDRAKSICGNCCIENVGT